MIVIAFVLFAALILAWLAAPDGRALSEKRVPQGHAVGDTATHAVGAD